MRYKIKYAVGSDYREFPLYGMDGALSVGPNCSNGCSNGCASSGGVSSGFKSIQALRRKILEK